MKAPHGLRELRERRLLSVNELSKRTGVAHETITRLESGAGNAWPRTLRKLADGLGISYEELYGEPAAPKAAPPRRERPVEPTSAGGSEELAEKFRKFEQQARKIAAGQALPRTAPSLVLAMEEELRRLDREGSLSEGVIEDYMVRAAQLARDVMDALEAQKRSIDGEIAAIREPQQRLEELTWEPGRAHDAS